MTKTLTCILCPNGCEITVEHENGAISACSGNQCPNGRDYAQQELQDPRRMLTTSVLVSGGDRPLVSVRLTKPIPRELMFPAMEQIKTLCLTAPVEPGTVLLENLFGTGSDLITTGRVERM